MDPTVPIWVAQLKLRREVLGMSFAGLAAHSGVSQPTVKRIFGGQASEASFGNVVAVAAALGVRFGSDVTDADEMLRRQARSKAEQVARLVQGTSALESQAVNQVTYERLVESSYHEFMAGPRRRLWAV